MGFESTIRLLDAKLRSGSWNKDFIARAMTGSGVMSGVRDAPGVVRNQKSGVENPADGVVDSF